MKKFLGWCLLCLMTVVISTGALVSLASCEKTKEVIDLPQVDYTQVKTCVQDIVNPVFTTLDDVQSFQQTLRSNAFIDSVFMSLPEKTLMDVSNVCMKKLSHVQKSDIVGEFLQNRNIYENLPPDNTSNVNTVTQTDPTPPIIQVQLTTEGKTTVTEAPPTGVGTAYKDTTIDGKKALIETSK